MTKKFQKIKKHRFMVIKRKKTSICYKKNTKYETLKLFLKLTYALLKGRSARKKFNYNMIKKGEGFEKQVVFSAKKCKLANL